MGSACYMGGIIDHFDILQIILFFLAAIPIWCNEKALNQIN